MDYLYYVLGCIVNVVYTISSMLCFFVCLFVLVLVGHYLPVFLNEGSGINIICKGPMDASL